MTDGLNREQFLRFRMALIPASGFQSSQYRMIELALARLNDLVHADLRSEFAQENDLSKLLENIYWRRGATLVETGEKALTLKQFEAKYDAVFADRAQKLRGPKDRGQIPRQAAQRPARNRRNELAEVPASEVSVAHCFSLSLVLRRTRAMGPLSA
jgi:tryptophan 2,3-dioxygenase